MNAANNFKDQRRPLYRFAMFSETRCSFELEHFNYWDQNIFKYTQYILHWTNKLINMIKTLLLALVLKKKFATFPKILHESFQPLNHSINLLKTLPVAIF